MAEKAAIDAAHAVFVYDLTETVAAAGSMPMWANAV